MPEQGAVITTDCIVVTLTQSGWVRKTLFAFSEYGTGAPNVTESAPEIAGQGLCQFGVWVIV